MELRSIVEELASPRDEDNSTPPAFTVHGVSGCGGGSLTTTVMFVYAGSFRLDVLDALTAIVWHEPRSKNA